jgi:glucosamine kinase
MIIVADSGGSKIDWRFLKKDGTIGQAHSPGFNPYYQPLNDLNKIVDEHLVPQVKESVEKIFYYGTGVSSEKNQNVIRDAFAKYCRGPCTMRTRARHCLHFRYRVKLMFV